MQLGGHAAVTHPVFDTLHGSPPLHVQAHAPGPTASHRAAVTQPACEGGASTKKEMAKIIATKKRFIELHYACNSTSRKVNNLRSKSGRLRVWYLV